MEQEEPQNEEEFKGPEAPKENLIFAVRTTANREEQVVDFLSGNIEKKKMEVFAIIKPHGMRSYIFIETVSLSEAEQAVFDVPYARGVLPQPVPYEEIEHMVETVKKEVNIQKGDIAEIISGPFKREKAKITKYDKEKEEVVVELLEAAVPIPITLKVDALKVIRRDDDDEE
jgi:transcription termination/antitermination protein NusG